MYRRVGRFVVLCALLFSEHVVRAQTIAFLPPAPSIGEIVRAQFSEAFNCAAPVPALTARSGSAFTFESVLSSGVINCPQVPFPPPQTSNFTVSLGALPQGTYSVTWNIYTNISGTRTLLFRSTASLTVNAGVGASVAAAPALSPWATLVLAGLCAVCGLGHIRIFGRTLGSA